VLLLGRSFFVLSSEYKKNQLDEFYYLIKYGGFSYRDLLIMPIFERRYFVDKFIEDTSKK
jgi:hypothetical protein